MKILLSCFLVISMISMGYAEPQLLFKSGFEDGVTITHRCDRGSTYDNDNYYLKGSDQGFDWDTDMPGDTGKSLVKTLVPCGYDVALYTSLTFDTVDAHSGSRSLHMNILNNAKLPGSGSNARLVLWPTALETTDFDEFYMKWYMKIPTYVIDEFEAGPKWLVLSTIWMSGNSPMTSSDYTPVNDLYVASNHDGQVYFKYHVGTQSTYVVERQLSSENDEYVPDDGGWHMYEYYFKAGLTDGRLMLKVDGQTALDWSGRTGTNVGTARILGLYGEENVAEIYVDDFELWDTMPDVTCIPDWDCTTWSSWSACVDGNQARTRTCSDLNSCSTMDGKPSETETQNCDPSATLLFKSGFEHNVAIVGSGVSYKITGNDAGYTWETNIPGNAENNMFNYLVCSGKQASDFVTTRIEDVIGPRGTSTKAFYHETIANDPCSSAASRSQYNIYPGVGDSSEKLEKIYSKYWMKIDNGLLSDSTWLLFMEWLNNDIRWGIYINDVGNSPYWYLQLQDLPERTIRWSKANYDISVPINEWFLLEVFWKQSAGSDGQIWFAIDGEKVAEYNRANKRTNGIGAWCIFKNYGPFSNGVWIDDVEVWSDVPNVTVYCGDGLCNGLDSCSNCPIDCSCSSTDYTVSKAYSVDIDGDISEFSDADSIVLTNSRGTTGTYKFMWDDNYLYIAADVKDTKLNAQYTVTDSNLWDDDSMEIIFDTKNDKGSILKSDDHKFIISSINTVMDAKAFDKTWESNIESTVKSTGTNNHNTDVDFGYIIEAKIPLTDLDVIQNNTRWGMNIVLNDEFGAGSDDILWSGTAVNVPDDWGVLTFVDESISLNQLIMFINQWRNNELSLEEIHSLINAWKIH